MKLCTRCNKRPAVVFITKLEGDKSVSEGICLRCARELGITHVDDIIKQSGLSEEDLERLDGEIESLMEMNTDGIEDTEDGKTPQMDFNRIFGGMMFRGNNGAAPTGQPQQNNKGSNHKNDDSDEKSKHLRAYCRDLT